MGFRPFPRPPHPPAARARPQGTAGVFQECTTSPAPAVRASPVRSAHGADCSCSPAGAGRSWKLPQGSARIRRPSPASAVPPSGQVLPGRSGRSAQLRPPPPRSRTCAVQVKTRSISGVTGSCTLQSAPGRGQALRHRAERPARPRGAAGSRWPGRGAVMALHDVPWGWLSWARPPPQPPPLPPTAVRAQAHGRNLPTRSPVPPAGVARIFIGPAPGPLPAAAPSGPVRGWAAQIRCRPQSAGVS